MVLYLLWNHAWEAGGREIVDNHAAADFFIVGVLLLEILGLGVERREVLD